MSSQSELLKELCPEWQIRYGMPHKFKNLWRKIPTTIWKKEAAEVVSEFEVSYGAPVEEP